MAAGIGDDRCTASRIGPRIGMTDPVVSRSFPPCNPKTRSNQHRTRPKPRPAANAPALSAASGTDRNRRLSGRKIAFGALAALAVGGAAWFGYDWWTVGRFTVSTDDAYVEAYNTTLAA